MQPKNIIDVFLNPSISIVFKIALILILILTLLFIDATLGFSYFSFMNSKMESLSKIERVISSAQLDSQSKQILITEREHIINKKSYKEELLSAWSQSVSNGNDRRTNNKRYNDENTIQIFLSNTSVWAKVFFFTLTSGLFYFIALFTESIKFIEKFEGYTKKDYLLVFTFLGILIVLTSIFNLLIPPYNYSFPKLVINVIVHALTMGAFITYTQYKIQKKEEKNL